MAETGPGSPDHPLSFAPIWAHTLELLRRHGELLWPLGAAFLFLPQLLIAVLAPDQKAEPDVGKAFLILLVAGASIVVTLVGQVAIVFIALNDGTAGLTLGQVLRRSRKLTLPALALGLIQGMAIVFGLILLVIPGLWIFARLSVALPAFVAGPHEPLEALRQSWRLTEGHALRILGCLATLLLGALLIYFGIVAIGIALGAISSIAAGTPSEGWGIGRWIFEVIIAAALAGLSALMMCFQSSLLKVLRSLPRTDG